MSTILGTRPSAMVGVSAALGPGSGADAPARRAHEAAAARALLAQLRTVREELLAAAGAAGERAVAGVAPQHRLSAINLLHYVALRSRDMRPLQEQLMRLGLSSLGRCEAHVLASLDAVLRALAALAGEPHVTPSDGDVMGYEEGIALLESNTQAVLGPAPTGRSVRIMVTMPAEAAHDYRLVRSLLESGMDCMRINCAHDGPAAWRGMIDNLRRAEDELGQQCRVLMDLAGPKLRTGALLRGMGRVRWRVACDPVTGARRPARVWLTAAEHCAGAPAADAVLPVPGRWLARLEVGEVVRFRDARSKRRELRIVGVGAQGKWAECAGGAVVADGTRLRVTSREDEAVVGPLPAAEIPLTLRTGDPLVLTRDAAPGRPAQFGLEGRLERPATIACTLPEVFADVRPGERVWLDDGEIGGVIEQVHVDAIRLRITHAAAKGSKLRSAKGINLPDSELRLPSLTAEDIEHLRFIATHADLVGVSFVRNPEAIAELQAHLRQLGAEPGIVVKVETRSAFDQLPQIVLAAFRSRLVAVMIARGDLAVECGYERLAEVQEEILWLAEAAHTPVIWATQVLEQLTKKGRPTRAEVTDAATAQRAECAMLNKGPHVVDAVRVLDDILGRMRAHQSKKITLLRRLRSWSLGA
ncbi:MAG TPA: pyruvate kinase [Chloroflexota bacterium]|nr:pyruvate kinase [Chloroflexota bacterium]